MLNIISFTKTRFFVLFVVIISTLSLVQFVNAQEMAGNQSEVEIVSGSCIINLEYGQKVSFSELISDPENKPVSVICQVTNHTDEDLFTDPSLTLQTSAGFGEEISLKTEDKYLLLSNTTQPVVFAFPEIDKGVDIQDIEASLVGESGDAVTATLKEEKGSSEQEPTHTATPEEENTAFYVIVSLLALVILLSILIYIRKKEEPSLPEAEMHNPEN